MDFKSSAFPAARGVGRWHRVLSRSIIPLGYICAILSNVVRSTFQNRLDQCKGTFDRANRVQSQVQSYQRHVCYRPGQGIHPATVPKKRQGASRKTCCLPKTVVLFLFLFFFSSATKQTRPSSTRWAARRQKTFSSLPCRLSSW